MTAIRADIYAWIHQILQTFMLTSWVKSKHCRFTIEQITIHAYTQLFYIYTYNFIFEIRPLWILYAHRPSKHTIETGPLWMHAQKYPIILSCVKKGKWKKIPKYYFTLKDLRSFRHNKHTDTLHRHVNNMLHVQSNTTHVLPEQMLTSPSLWKLETLIPYSGSQQ